MEERSGEEFRRAVIDWYHKNGREFYWRTESITAFELLITELLLKRTPAERVDQLGEEILQKLDIPRKVADMNRSDLVCILEPLGLQERRSKNIQDACWDLVQLYNGSVPDDQEQLLAIDGVGEYIADSILSTSQSNLLRAELSARATTN